MTCCSADIADRNSALYQTYSLRIALAVMATGQRYHFKIRIMEIKRHRKCAFKMHGVFGGIHDLGTASYYILVFIDGIEQVYADAGDAVGKSNFKCFATACGGYSGTDYGLFRKDFMRYIFKVAHTAAVFVKRDERRLAEISCKLSCVFLHYRAKSQSCAYNCGVARGRDLGTVI